MSLIALFAIAGVIIFIGFLGELIFDKTNIPDVVWLMMLGILMGYFSDYANHPVLSSIAPLFTTFALIFILFEGALHIDLKSLLSGIAGGSSIALLNFVFCIAIVAVAMVLLGWSVLEGLLLGAILGGASSDVIIPLTKKIRIKPHTSLVLTFESAISDVLCIVSAITIEKFA